MTDRASEEVEKWLDGAPGEVEKWLDGERMGRETKAGLRRNWKVRDSQ